MRRAGQAAGGACVRDSRFPEETVTDARAALKADGQADRLHRVHADSPKAISRFKMKFLSKIVFFLLLAAILGSAVFLTTWDIPAPTATIEVTVPNERFR